MGGGPAEKPVILYQYAMTRSRSNVQRFLKGFSGILESDAFSGYKALDKEKPEIRAAFCWAHARQKWREAMPDGATVKTSKAAVGFQYCTKLFSLEKKGAYPDPKHRNAYRQNVVLPLLEEYFAWLKTVHPEKGSKLEDAVRYSLNQKQQLMAFLDHGVPPHLQ